MDIFYCNNLLFPLPLQGFLWLFVFFVFCFCGVHLFKLARLGAENFRKKEPQSKEEQQKDKEKEKAPASQEPIYYIVERKTRRAKPSYKEPKQIRFK